MTGYDRAIKFDPLYTTAVLIHEQRLRDAEVDRVAAAATRSIREALREVADRAVESPPAGEPVKAA